MKTVYCANCGTALEITKRVIKPGKIIDTVPYHECLDTPILPDLTPIEIPTKEKFVKKLDELNRLPGTSTASFGDQRKVEHTRKELDSTAPTNLLRQFKDLQNSVPVKDFEDPKE